MGTAPSWVYGCQKIDTDNSRRANSSRNVAWNKRHSLRRTVSSRAIFLRLAVGAEKTRNYLPLSVLILADSRDLTRAAALRWITCLAADLSNSLAAWRSSVSACSGLPALTAAITFLHSVRMAFFVGTVPLAADEALLQPFLGTLDIRHGICLSRGFVIWESSLVRRRVRGTHGHQSADWCVPRTLHGFTTPHGCCRRRTLDSRVTWRSCLVAWKRLCR